MNGQMGQSMGKRWAFPTQRFLAWYPILPPGLRIALLGLPETRHKPAKPATSLAATAANSHHWREKRAGA